MKSRFLNVSPRAFLRQKDSVNILPSIERTGDQNNLGNDDIYFSENDSTFVFGNNRIRAPYMLPLNKVAESGFLTGTLVFSASVTDKNAYFEKVISSSAIYPYKDGENIVAFEGIGSGFPEDKYPGFSSSDRSKSVIRFNISTNQDTDVYKLNAVESARDPSGPFLGQNRSGFMYFNRSQGRWADIGIRDRASNLSKSYNPVLYMSESLAAGKYTVTEISAESTLCQFAGSPYGISCEIPYYDPKDVEALEARGYHRIGEPTSFFGAPYSPKYHARENEAFPLGDYITSPFVVDRIIVKFPVTALRTQIPNPTTDFGFAHDIENYVFFIYVQNRTQAEKDTRQDVSSSIRYLVAKESFCFYNKFTLDRVSPGTLPIHQNGQAIAFTMIESSLPAVAAVTQSLDANIFLNFRPKTFNNGFGTTSKMAAAGEDGSTAGGPPVTGSVIITNFWRGGQYASGSLGQIYRVPNTKLLNARTGSEPTFQKNLFVTPSPRSLLSSFWEGSSNLINSGSGIAESSLEISTVTVETPTMETPIILFPDDELVFGIESGVNPVMIAPGRVGLGYDTDVLNVTGSRLTIRAGDASVSLYGTNVGYGRESLPELNQYLGSDAVHEDLHEVGPFDQFDILAPKILSGSYVDNLIENRLGLRRRVGFASRGQGWITGSLQRNVRAIDSERTYYDSFIPTNNVIVDGLENSAIGTNNFGERVIVLTAVASNGYVVEDDRDNNVLLSRPFTFEREAGQARQRNTAVSLINAGGFFVERFTGDQARFALYYNGNNPRVFLGTLNKSEYTGARSLRYGLSNVSLTNPSAVFRRDSFGQLRDMLEQTRDAKFVFTKNGKDNVIRSTVIATFVSASSDTVTDGIYTQCSNLSIECTSSLPFIDDGVSHNRGNLPSYTVSFGPNNLIFGVTGSFGRQ